MAAPATAAEDQPGPVLNVRWNQDYGCFICALPNGFRVYNADPLKEKQKREFDDGGVGYAEMLFRCNYIALVGGGPHPKFPAHKVVIWDDLKRKCVIEVPFKSEVKAVKLRRDRIVVVLERAVSVWTFTQSPQHLDTFDTCANPHGVCELCPDATATNSLLAFPGPERGQVKLVDLANKKEPLIIAAHETQLSYVALNADGTRLATASEKGTLIRVFDAQSGTKLHELRRGSSRAAIRCIAFCKDSTMLCVSSDSKTVHVFRLIEHSEKPRSSIASGNDFLPKYLRSQWSDIKFHVSCPDTICAFSTQTDNTVLAVGKDGSWFKATFPPEGGDCQVEEKNFITGL